MKTAIITGATRGLGLQTARVLAQRGYRVVACSRTGVSAAELGLPEPCVGAVLDVASEASVAAFAAWLDAHAPEVHVLVNNAGLFAEPYSSSVVHHDSLAILQSFDVNALGALRVASVVVPHMTSGGNVVQVSSGMGALSDMGGGTAGYRMSKAALNALTRILHAETPDAVRVNSVCPGWVQTDMGGASASRTIEEGAAGIVWAATLEDGGPSGGFFRDGAPIPW